MAIGGIQRENDAPLGDTDYRLPIAGIPNDGDSISYSVAQGAFVPVSGVGTSSFTVTGTGNVEDDTNLMDFTGQSPIVGQAAEIAINATVSFTHNLVGYNWVGPQPVTVGVGGNHVAVAGDFAATGTADHALLSNRTAANSHDQAAITGLVTDQAAQDTATGLVQTNLDNHSGPATDDAHNTSNITGLDADQTAQDVATQAVADGLNAHETALADSHTTSQITGLDAAQSTQNADIITNAQNLNDHEIAADPHPQYALETAALSAFTAAGYGGVTQVTPVGLPDITATPQILPADTAVITVPRGITQNIASDGLNVNEQGVWLLSISFALTHDGVNFARSMTVEIFDVTTATIAGNSPIAVGRNQEGTNFSVTIMIDVAQVNEGDLLVIRLVSSNTFLTVVLDGMTFSATHISEAQGL